jgi:acyl-coenzyme A thioesterase PaaI-like protein
MRSLQDTYAPHNRCFGCGAANEKGLRIKSYPEGDGLVAEFRPEAHHEAFPGVVNGGILGTLLDCHGNWTAVWALQRASGAEKPPVTVTADFHVFLRRPTPMDAVLKLRSKVAQQMQDRCVIETTVEANGKITATCTGTFIAVKEGHPAFQHW